jgi:hypothetical protein
VAYIGENKSAHRAFVDTNNKSFLLLVGSTNTGISGSASQRSLGRFEVKVQISNSWQPLRSRNEMCIHFSFSGKFSVVGQRKRCPNIAVTFHSYEDVGFFCFDQRAS